MVSLESPLLTLGALYLAGQDDRGRRFTGGESGKGLLAGGFAAGSSQFVVDEVRSMAGLDSSALSDELAQALLGAGIARFGGPIPQSNAMARGIHYNVAEQAFTQAGVTLGDFLNGGSGGSTSQTRTRSVARSRSRSRSVSRSSPQSVVTNSTQSGGMKVY